MASPQERILRIERLKDSIKKSFEEGNVVKKEKLLGFMSCEWGLSRRTGLEYIEGIVATEVVKEEGKGKDIKLTWVGEN